MLFTSIDFAVFLVVVLAVYWLLRGRLTPQNLLLLAASYFFYGYWDVRFLYLIVISTVVDYSCARMIDRGSMALTDRLKASGFLLGSALLFVVPDYNVVQFQHSGLQFSLQVEWALLFAHAFGWKVFAASLIAVVLANLSYSRLQKLDEAHKRKGFVIASIVANLSILGFFKYFNFFADSFSGISQTLFGITPEWYTLEIILPVGISFYTFQTMSYTIDVYRRELKASKKLIDFAAYVSFFPQLVAGPIERGKRLLPQFQKLRPPPERGDIQEGCWLIAWGLFKKLVIADNLALVVNQTFAPFDQMLTGISTPEDGLRLLVALYAFALQIYCDFSGYTDIARGTARLFGFNLMINFRLPYFATDPSSFWRRWHISLSTWLRDYLYIPLGGNRGSSLMTYRNLSLTMLLGGLWHGASWTFVIWGAYQGALLCIYRALGIDGERAGFAAWKKLLMMVFFFQLTCIGWLIFRAQNVETISIFLDSIFLHPFGSEQAWLDLKTIFFYAWFLILFQVIQYRTGNLNPMTNWHWFVRLNVWIYVVMSLLTLASSSGREFIYFAF